MMRCRSDALHDITVAAYCALGLAESPTLTLKSVLDSFVGENPGPMLSADQIGRWAAGRTGRLSDGYAAGLPAAANFVTSMSGLSTRTAFD